MSKHIDIAELRRQIDSGELTFSGSCNCIESGELTNELGGAFEYEINHGWDIVSANSCDRRWGAFNIRLLHYLEKQEYSDEELDAALSTLQSEHLHWDWFKKAACYTAVGYEWFFMFADGKPQGACLIYHPKDSIIDSKDIFYIEFVEVAPWNRDNPMAKREFRGVGSLIIKCVLAFAVGTLQLEPGFSLHSLPQATGYYEKIGMKSYPERDKDVLTYFEMPRARSAEMLGVA